MLKRSTSIVIEWSRSATGLLGAAILASNSAITGYGFMAFFISNLFWIAYAVRSRAWGLLAMQIGFTTTSVIGIWRWFFID